MKHFHYVCVDSTNLVAWRLIDQTISDRGWAQLNGAVITSDIQTAGKGQWGRTWESSAGGLYLSMIYFPAQSDIQPGMITLWTAWGIAAALGDCVPGVRLKWPNDLVVDRYKLGGILTETRRRGEQIKVAVIGVGINGWNTPPSGGIALKDLAGSLNTWEQLKGVVIEGMERGRIRAEQEGMAGIITEYQSLLLTQTVRHNQRHGRIHAILPHGGLTIIWQDGSLVSYPPGQITLGY